MANAPKNPVVWTEIPVTDMSRSRAFYETVFDWEMVENTDGPNPILMFPHADPKSSVAGHLYPGKPSESGPTIHLEVPGDLATAKARCAEAGGKVHDMDIPIPAGMFCYAQDPDGNSIGLFQPNDRG